MLHSTAGLGNGRNDGNCDRIHTRAADTTRDEAGFMVDLLHTMGVPRCDSRREARRAKARVFAGRMAVDFAKSIC